MTTPSFADKIVLITGTARGVAAAMYLCSDEARFCTGTTLILDGGYTAQ